MIFLYISTPSYSSNLLYLCWTNVLPTTGWVQSVLHVHTAIFFPYKVLRSMGVKLVLFQHHSIVVLISLYTDMGRWALIALWCCEFSSVPLCWLVGGVVFYSLTLSLCFPIIREHELWWLQNYWTDSARGMSDLCKKATVSTQGARVALQSYWQGKGCSALAVGTSERKLTVRYWTPFV